MIRRAAYLLLAAVAMAAQVQAGHAANGCAKAFPGVGTPVVGCLFIQNNVAPAPLRATVTGNAASGYEITRGNLDWNSAAVRYLDIPTLKSKLTAGASVTVRAQCIVVVDPVNLTGMTGAGRSLTLTTRQTPLTPALWMRYVFFRKKVTLRAADELVLSSLFSFNCMNNNGFLPNSGTPAVGGGHMYYELLGNTMEAHPAGQDWNKVQDIGVLFP